MLIINNWKYKNLFHPSEYDLNTSLALKCAKNGTLDYLCETYTDIDKKDIISLINEIPNAKNIFKGKGIDLGGGPGVISGTLVNYFKNIDSIILLEIVRTVLETCFPIIKDQYLTKENKNKVFPTIGSFDEMELDKNSLDFAIAWDAMHHSFNPSITLEEVYRVLVKGGFFVIIDRAHNNDTTNEEIDQMLSVQYPEEFIIYNNLPSGTVLTRSQNGEHEYRFNDWENFFEEANFKVINKKIILEKHPRNDSYLNDAQMEQYFVPYSVGGYERRKVIYVLQSQ